MTLGRIHSKKKKQIFKKINKGIKNSIRTVKKLKSMGEGILNFSTLEPFNGLHISMKFLDQISTASFKSLPKGQQGWGTLTL